MIGILLITGPLVQVDKTTKSYTVIGVASLAPKYSKEFNFSAVYTRNDGRDILRWIKTKIRMAFKIKKTYEYEMYEL